MRITIGQLRRVIKEEIQRAVEEDFNPKARVNIGIREKTPQTGESQQELTSASIKDAFDSFGKKDVSLTDVAQKLGIKNMNLLTSQLIKGAGLDLYNGTTLSDPSKPIDSTAPAGPIKKSNQPVMFMLPSS